MIPIYVKTVYSFLSSLITIDDLISLAKQKKSDYLCICDNNMYGVMEFVKKCQLNSIKPIIGLDTNICLLFAKNYSGYQNLMKLSTIKSERNIKLEDLELYKNNLICFCPYNSDIDLKGIYSDLYLYSDDGIDNTLPLPKTSCLNKEDLSILKYLHLLKDGKKIDDEYEFDNNYYYQNIVDERFDQIFQNCSISFPKYNLNLPNYCKYNDTKGLDSDEYLYNLSIAGLSKRMNGKVSSRYKERLFYELDIIKKMGFSNYFLIVYDYVKYAKSHGILVGPGRGSAAGSLVAYSIGITEVDPIKYDLLFERFLNIERVTMPDIDIDFPDEKRDEVIRYVQGKYGKDKVSLITTFNTFGSKMAIRDMGRVMNVPSYVIDDLCKKIGNNSLSLSIKDDAVKNIINSDNKLKKLFQVASRIEGLPRHTSIHAAGVVMSNIPLNEIVPLSLEDDIYVSAYEAMYLEELGLLKMDFLGLRNLTIIDNTLKLINEYEKTNFKFNDLPLLDKKTNLLFSNGDTLGIFQFESVGMQKFLMNLKPNSFLDIYNANAFYRPGPSSHIASFLKRREGKEKIDYFDERLKDILKDTCGIIVYQEQIMQIANIMASFTLGEADILRRAMSKKKKDEIEKYHEKFISNALKNGYSKELSSEIYQIILDFASYGFNKSHSVAYSMISYRMAYLKANYPIYFYLALLDSSSMDEDKIKIYIKEMKKKNIQVLKPDINKSRTNFDISYGKILLPLNIIKGISSDVSQKIIMVREDGFKDIYDVFAKLSSYNFSKNIYEVLIKAGALDSFGYNRNTIVSNLDNLINYGILTLNLESQLVLKPEIEIFDEYTKEILIANEKDYFGFYLNNHPVSFYKSKVKSINLVDIPKYFNKNVSCVVMVDRIKEITTKKGEKMAFISCSDEERSIDVTIFPKVYMTLSNLKKSDIIIIDGIVERRKDFEIIANSVKDIKEII